MKSDVQHTQETCAGKKRYLTRTEAREAIRGIAAQPVRRRRLRNLHSYHCPACDGYHLTSA